MKHYEEKGLLRCDNPHSHALSRRSTSKKGGPLPTIHDSAYTSFAPQQISTCIPNPPPIPTCPIRRISILGEPRNSSDCQQKKESASRGTTIIPTLLKRLRFVHDGAIKWLVKTARKLISERWFRNPIVDGLCFWLWRYPRLVQDDPKMPLNCCGSIKQLSQECQRERSNSC